jgi:hypothetical protein
LVTNGINSLVPRAFVSGGGASDATGLASVADFTYAP